MGEPELNPDGQTFTLNFNEPLDSKNLDTSKVANNFRIFVDGENIGATFDNNSTTLSQDGTSLTLKLGDNLIIENEQQVLIAYEAPFNNDVPGSIAASSTLSDTSGNDLQSFAFEVINDSEADFSEPELQDMAGPIADPTGQTFSINFEDPVFFDQNSIKDAFEISVDGEKVSSSDFRVSSKDGEEGVNTVIEVKLDQRVYNDQILTFSYTPEDLTDPSDELQDQAGNTVNRFSLLVDTSAIADSAPDLEALRWKCC